MSKLALIADFDVEPEACDAFQSLMRDHAAAALRDEEGCLQFDVAVARDDPNRVILYEVYRDQAALDTHMGSDRLARTRQAYADMITDRRVTICHLSRRE